MDALHITLMITTAVALIGAPWTLLAFTLGMRAQHRRDEGLSPEVPLPSLPQKPSPPVDTDPELTPPRDTTPFDL